MTAVKELMSRVLKAEEAFANPQNREKSLLESSSVVSWNGICCSKSKSGMNRQRVSDVQAMLNHQIITNRNSQQPSVRSRSNQLHIQVLEQQFPHFYLWEKCSIYTSHRTSVSHNMDDFLIDSLSILLHTWSFRSFFKMKLFSRAPPGHLLDVKNKKIVRHFMGPERNVLSVSLCILVPDISICFLCFHVKLCQMMQRRV